MLTATSASDLSSRSVPAEALGQLDRSLLRPGTDRGRLPYGGGADLRRDAGTEGQPQGMLQDEQQSFVL